MNGENLQYRTVADLIRDTDRARLAHLAVQPAVTEPETAPDQTPLKAAAFLVSNAALNEAGTLVHDLTLGPTPLGQVALYSIDHGIGRNAVALAA